MSYQINPSLRRFIGYFTLTALETGLSKGSFKMMHSRVYAGDSIDKSDKDWSTNKNKCMEGFLHEERDPAAFGISLFAPIMCQLGILIAVATIILLAEVMTTHIKAIRFHKMMRAIKRYVKRLRRKIRRFRRIWCRCYRKKRSERRQRPQQEQQLHP